MTTAFSYSGTTFGFGGRGVPTLPSVYSLHMTVKVDSNDDQTKAVSDAYAIPSCKTADARGPVTGGVPSRATRSLNDVPVELLTNIIDWAIQDVSLDSRKARHLSNYSLVCRRLTAIAQRRLFATLFVNSGTDAAHAIAGFISTHPVIADYVQTIDWSSLWPNEVYGSIDLVERIAQSTPRVTTLCITGAKIDLFDASSREPELVAIRPSTCC